MNNQENPTKSKLTLTQKIHQLQAISEDLAELEQAENISLAGDIAHLLKIMVNLFTEVDQRLTALEKEQEVE